MLLGEEEDVSSECISGCQSGWTTYLEQSSCDSPDPQVYKGSSFQEEEEEDLSMVSDASSGPPHFREEDEHCRCYLRSNACSEGSGCLCSALTPADAWAKHGGKKRRVEPERQKEHSSLLDDTASSPLFSYSKASFSGDKHMKPPMEGASEFSCGFSGTHCKRNYALEKQMGYLQSSACVKPNPARPVSRKAGKKIW